MILPTILAYLLGPTVWLLKFFFLSGWSLVKFFLWLTSPPWLLAAIVGAVLGLHPQASRPTPLAQRDLARPGVQASPASV